MLLKTYIMIPEVPRSSFIISRVEQDNVIYYSVIFVVHEVYFRWRLPPVRRQTLYHAPLLLSSDVQSHGVSEINVIKILHCSCIDLSVS